MDGHRFDELARLLGAGATRRRVLKGLAGGILGFGGSTMLGGRARAGSVPIGGSCTVWSDCQGAGLEGGNADCRNGTCCGTQGVGSPNAVCSSPSDCCPGHECQGGECVFTNCSAAGVSCADDSSCCGTMICSSGTCAEPPTCAGRDEACENNADCCGQYDVCNGGVCKFCSVEGESCPGGNECCSSGGAGFFCLDGTCIDPVDLCHVEGQSCNDTGDCCEGLTCNADNLCEGASTCVGFANLCVTDPDNCCEGLMCQGGSCCALPGESCADIQDCCVVAGNPASGDCVGGVCTGAAACADAGDSCETVGCCDGLVCGDNRRCTAGLPGNCTAIGGGCVASSDCCSGLACVNGACAATSSGGDDGGGEETSGEGTGGSADGGGGTGSGPTGGVTNLPTTGAGQEDGGNTLTGVLLAASAALAAGKLLDRTAPETEATNG